MRSASAAEAFLVRMAAAGRDRRPHGRVLDIALLGKGHCRPLGRFGGFEKQRALCRLLPTALKDRQARKLALRRFAGHPDDVEAARAGEGEGLVDRLERDSGNEGVTVHCRVVPGNLVKVIGRLPAEPPRDLAFGVFDTVERDVEDLRPGQDKQNCRIGSAEILGALVQAGDLPGQVRRIEFRHALHDPAVCLVRQKTNGVMVQIECKPGGHRFHI